MTAQSNTASISGSVIDGKTQKPIPSAVVVAIRSGVPNFTKNTRSGGDGAFLISGLAAGNYTLCVQTPGAAYLDPCQWNGAPGTVTVVSGQAAKGPTLRLTAASILSIVVQDPQKILTGKT